VGVANTQGPLQQPHPMRPILTARQQRWVRGQEEQHHLLTLVSSVAKLVIGHETALVSAPAGYRCLLVTQHALTLAFCKVALAYGIFCGIQKHQIVQTNACHSDNSR